jgi:hypothetical protein
MVIFTATDAAGNSGSAAGMVIVADTTPPLFAAVTSTPDELWPPNHRMRHVHFTVEATDICDPDPLITLYSVGSSEPDNAPNGGDGNTTGDIGDADIGTPDFDIRLRAERSGNGPGRAYTTTYMATDDQGNTSTASAITYVPHDRGGVVEPLMLELSGGSETALAWDEVPGALGFDVVRGNLANMQVIGSTTNMGPTVCIDSDSIDAETPPSGGIFFYLAQVRYATFQTSFGTASAAKSRVVEGNTDCN